MKKVISMIFLFIVCVLVFSSLTYALWAQTLHVSGRMQTGRKDIRIACYKCLHCCCCPPNKVNCSLLNRQTILVTWKNATHHCKVWVIAKIRNAGTLPVDILMPTITIDNPELRRYLRVRVFFFGPFNRDLRIPSSSPDYWHSCNTPPIQLDPGQSLLMCVLFRFSFCTPHEYLEDPINITISLNYRLWNYGG